MPQPLLLLAMPAEAALTHVLSLLLQPHCLSCGTHCGTASLKEEAGLKPAMPRRKDVQTAHGLSKGAKEKSGSPFLPPSPLTEQRRLNCSLKAATCNPVSYSYSKHPHLKMIMLQRDFPEFFSLALKVPHVPQGTKGWQPGDTGITL